MDSSDSEQSDYDDKSDEEMSSDADDVHAVEEVYCDDETGIGNNAMDLASSNEEERSQNGTLKEANNGSNDDNLSLLLKVSFCTAVEY